jgi:rare lipoprotein A
MDREIGIRRPHAYAVCALLCGGLALPASGLASSGSGGSGGGGLTPGGGSATTPTGTSPQPTPAPQSGNTTVTTSGSGITLATRASAMLRNGLTFSGTAPQNLAGDTIEVQRSGHETNWTWAATVSATVASGGSFTAVWHTNHIGRFAIRAVVVGAAGSGTSTTAASDAITPSATAAASTPSLTITVYRPSLATQYGPGFYGRRTACGQKLRQSTIGLANRTLRCGEDVAIYYQGRTLVVPVIDRGPYANGADWDLTEATGKELGIDGTAEIGAVSLPIPTTSAAVRAREH